MKVDTFTRAYKEYDATLRNVQQSICAWNTKNELVVSLWEHSRVKGPPKGTLQFSNGRPLDYDSNGQKEFLENLEKAYTQKSDIRLVLVKGVDPSHVTSGKSGSDTKKTISVRPELIGNVLNFSPSGFLIEFRRA